MAKKHIAQKSQKHLKNTLILGIETSCDETAAAIVSNGTKILSSEYSSQIDIHNKYGGVVPEVASRLHIEAIPHIVQEALDRADIDFDQIDKIAVTQGPGLVPALLVGQSYAQGLAFGLGKPLIQVNHLFGHVFSNFLEEHSQEYLAPEFPLLTLLVSGGHTQLILSTSHTNQKVIGETRDDAAGEAFDKVARMLDLGYPGGPIIDKLAKEGFEDAIDFPRPMIDSGDSDFSFSGLKTAVREYIGKNRPQVTKSKKLDSEIIDHFNKDVAASFQEALVDTLVAKTIDAADQLLIENIAIAGGVAANSRLRDRLGRVAHDRGLKLHYPSLKLCIDNAAMVAGAAYYL